jgi:hypothetical protein
MMQWFHNDLVIHSFVDNSGTVFFHLHSGETLALTLPLAAIYQQLPDISSELRQDTNSMRRLKLFLSEQAISQLEATDGV